MSLDPRLHDALCASCGGRVGDARCATCRAALRDLQSAPLPAGPVLLAALLLLVTLVLLQLA